MVYEQRLKVPASATDYEAKFGLIGTISFIQDNMCEFFKILGCDGITMIPKCQSFFVITKTKIKFRNFPKWADEICLKTRISDVSKIRVNLSNSILLNDGEVAIDGVQELCPIDSNTRRIRSVESTLFPKDIELEKSNIGLTYCKFNFDKSDFVLKKKYEINLSNVDYYMHTNNVEYVKFCMSVLDVKMFENKSIYSFEIHYLKECVLGDVVDVYIKECDEKIEFVLHNGKDVVVEAEMILSDKK